MVTAMAAVDYLGQHPALFALACIRDREHPRGNSHEAVAILYLLPVAHFTKL
jgi:hypothetical protein